MKKRQITLTIESPDRLNHDPVTDERIRKAIEAAIGGSALLRVIPGSLVVSDAPAITPGIYQHFKGGLYEVYGVAELGDTSHAPFLGAANHSESGMIVPAWIALEIPSPRLLVSGKGSDEPMVVYRPMYGARRLTARPLSMWSEHVERDGYSRPRFRLVDGGDGGAEK